MTINMREVIELTAELAAKKAIEPLEERLNGLSNDMAVVKDRLLGENGLLQQFQEEKNRTDKSFAQVHDRISVRREETRQLQEHKRTVATVVKSGWKGATLIAMVLFEVWKELHAKS